MSLAFILLGGNRGDVQNTFRISCEKLTENHIRIIRKSSLYTSPAWGFSDPEPFMNQVLEIETNLHPEELLRILLQIETDLGRIRNIGSEYSSRTIDMDILLFDSVIIHSSSLEVPHPRMNDRRFALLPLAELVPEMVHPLTGETISSLLENCKDLSDVKILEHAL
jgi:2-amino-4-hydroxy-6-hydroxymethyldihydropteridine diphosphokinase